jgi:hypothetical protein
VRSSPGLLIVSIGRIDLVEVSFIIIDELERVPRLKAGRALLRGLQSLV